MNSPGPPISIVLADDHPVVLHGTASILRAQPDINVVALCEDGIAAAEAIRRLVPNIAVLDIRFEWPRCPVGHNFGWTCYEGYIYERCCHR
jgi:CheY-like chemotaxis protein